MFAARREKLAKLLYGEYETDNPEFDIEEHTCMDVVLIDSPENLYYYSGFTGGEAMLVMFTHGNSSVYIITDSRYYEQVCKECPDIPLIRLNNHTYVEMVSALLYGQIKDDFDEDTKTVISEADTYNVSDGFTIAIEESMNLSRYLKLTKALDKCQLTVASEQINGPRMVKEEKELELLRRAEHIGDEAFTHILSVLKPGITESEISLELELYMKKLGASRLSFDTIVASGPNSSMPHAQVTDRIIQNGDFVTMDFGCIYKGYCSDMTRTVAIGNPTEEMKKVYQIVLDANLRAMDKIKSGVKCSDIDAVARNYISENGYGDYFGHGLGHGVGLYIHEEPRFSPKCNIITRENMVITDEPGIYLPGRFGVRIEDLVVVKQDGYERLSESEKKLIVI